MYTMGRGAAPRCVRTKRGATAYGAELTREGARDDAAKCAGQGSRKWAGTSEHTRQSLHLSVKLSTHTML